MNLKTLLTNFFLPLLVAGFTSYAVIHFSNPMGSTLNASAIDSVYDRVLRTKTLRCGYIVYAPTIIVDPNTGAISGIMHDVVEEVAKQMGLKVEWVEEVNYSNMIEALKTNRIDMVCANIWNTLDRAPLVNFNIPLFYSGIGVWVRQNDSRFDHNLSQINRPDVRIATMDGDIATAIAADLFPQAKIVSLPQNSDWTHIMVNIANNKADVTFHEAWLGADYLSKNPGTVKNIALRNPLKIFANSTMIKGGESRFKNMFDQAYASLLQQGFIDRILNKYEEYPGAFYRVSKPYEIPQ